MLGMSFVAIRVVMAENEAPATLGFLRYGLAVVILLPLLFWSRRFPSDLKTLAAIIGLGALQFGLFHLFVNTALESIPASRGAVIFSLIPVMTMIIASLAGREMLSKLNLFAAFLSVVGVSLAIGEKAFENSGEVYSWWGELLFFLAVCCGAIYNSFSSQILKSSSLVQTTIIGMSAGVICILPIAFMEDLPTVVLAFSPTDWLWILYLAGPAAALSLFLFNWGLQKLSPARAAIYVPLAPVAAAAFSAQLLGEQLSSFFLIGLALAISGPLLLGLKSKIQSSPRRS